jgi:DNA primase
VIPPELIEQIRDAADIVTVIGEHVELKRTGSDFRGPCPFHGGSHRNFSVVPRKQMYHCFVCHESGDVFTFLMKKLGLDYPTAVREIAGKVGITVPDTRTAGPDPNEPLYSALAAAADWFARRLREGADAEGARRYLDGRELDDATRDLFQLGYAPPRGEELLESLGRGGLGIEDEILKRAGLLVEREGQGPAPRFRGRLIFPIADVRGRIVGFGGRLLGEGEPKYLNSPETPVFHKGTLLYLLDRARGAIRTAETAIIVEGYVDAIRLHVAGVATAVAPLGTALTPEQARLLRRYTRHVALAYDADTAGLRSTFRAGDELLRQGAAVSVVTLPEGEDPDTLVRRGGAAAFEALLGESVDVFERKLQLIERKGLLKSLEGRREALDRLLPTIRAAADAITRELYIARAAERTGVARDVLEQEVQRLDARTHAHGDAPRGRPEARGGEREPVSGVREAAPRPVEIPIERALVQRLLTAPALVARAREAVAAAEFRHPVYREIVEALYAGAPGPVSPDAQAVWMALAAEPAAEARPEDALAACIAWMQDRRTQERRAEIDRLIDLAPAEDKARLMREKQDLAAGSEHRFGRKAFQSQREPKY